MKKMIAGLVAALVTTAGLMTVSGVAPAQAAACVATKYNPNACVTVSVTKPKNVGTTAKKATKVKKNKATKVVLKYTAQKPTSATVVVKIFLNKAKKPLKTNTYKNIKSGANLNYKTPKLKKKGTYKIAVTITPTTGGKASSLTYYVKVK